MAKVFITGSGGFIGKNLIPLFLQRGYQVTGLVRNKKKAELIQGLGAKTVIGDITQREVLEEPVKEADFVVHLAGAYVAASRHLLHSIDYLGTKDLIEICLKSPIKCLVFPSAIEVYGDTKKGLATESTSPNPNLTFGQIKLAVEQLLAEACRKRGLPVVVLRIAQVYGVGGRFLDNLVSLAKGKLHYPPIWPGPGNVGVSFVHVSDVAKAFALALEKRPIGQIYNVCDDEPATWNEFLQFFFERTNARKKVIHIHIPIPIALVVAKALQISDRLRGRPLLAAPDIVRLFLTSRKCSNEKVRGELVK